MPLTNSMLYEIYVEGTLSAHFMTAAPFGTTEARKIFPDAVNIAVKRVNNFFYDKATVVPLYQVTRENIDQVINAYIKEKSCT